MPAEKPCSSRPTTTSEGAAIPMLRYPGVQAMDRMPTDIVQGQQQSGPPSAAVRIGAEPDRHRWARRNPAPKVPNESINDRNPLPDRKERPTDRGGKVPEHHEVIASPGNCRWRPRRTSPIRETGTVPVVACRLPYTAIDTFPVGAEYSRDPCRGWRPVQGLE